MNAARPLATLALTALIGATAVAQTTKSGGMAPAGEGPGSGASAAATGPDRTMPSSKNRADVKGDTRRAERAGALQPAGEAAAPGMAPDKAAPKGEAMKSRAATKPAAGTTQPAGEATQGGGTAPMK